MSEQTISAITTGVLSGGFAVLAILYALLTKEMLSRRSPTRLGVAMKRKYGALFVLCVIMALLHVYSTYFNVFRDVGLFTFWVRTSLRAGAAVAIAIASFAAAHMYIEYIRASQNDNDRGPDD